MAAKKPRPPGGCQRASIHGRSNRRRRTAKLPRMRNPYLVGTTIYLRPLEEDDAAVCHPWFNDPEVWRTLAVRGRPNTQARSREYICARVGFQVEGRRREQVFIEGRWVDEILLGLLAGHLRPPPG